MLREGDIRRSPASKKNKLDRKKNQIQSNPWPLQLCNEATASYLNFLINCKIYFSLILTALSHTYDSLFHIFSTITCPLACSHVRLRTPLAPFCFIFVLVRGPMLPFNLSQYINYSRINSTWLSWLQARDVVWDAWFLLAVLFSRGIGPTRRKERLQKISSRIAPRNSGIRKI